jgi:hypothetical protein
MLLLVQAALPVPQELPAYPELPVRQGQADLLVQAVLLGHPDSQELVEHPENPVLVALAALLVQAVLLEHSEQAGLLVHPVQAEALPALPVRPDRLVLQVQVVHQDQAVLQVLMESADNQQHPVLPDLLVQPVHQD